MAKKRDLPPFEKQDRPKKVKKIYAALKRKYGESMPAEVKARIASRKGSSRPSKRESGPPYSGPLHYKRKGGRYVKKSYDTHALLLHVLGKTEDPEKLKRVGQTIAKSKFVSVIKKAFEDIISEILRRLNKK